MPSSPDRLEDPQEVLEVQTLWNGIIPTGLISVELRDRQRRTGGGASAPCWWSGVERRVELVTGVEGTRAAPKGRQTWLSGASLMHIPLHTHAPKSC